MSGLGALLAASAGDELGTRGAAALVAVAGLTSADASDGVCCLLHAAVTPAIRTSRQMKKVGSIRRDFMLQTL
jgi:hypothetical protein